MSPRQLLPVLPLLVLTCSTETAPPRGPASLDDIAARYLELELGVGRHDSGHVDAYFGPEEFRAAAERAERSLDELESGAADLAADLERRLDTAGDRDRDRIRSLLARIGAMRLRIDINRGERPDFDRESEVLFGAVAPDYGPEHFEAILADIDALLPGAAPLADRVNAFSQQFEVPPDRLADVFDAAIAECRRRTQAHIDLPAGESFIVEYVTDKPWSGYNWYQGDSQSLIQVNTDLPITIDRAVDLGCHEGYPGHHTYNALLEKHVVGELGWLEFSLYPLFSPQSLIAEGSGNYGIDIAFPGEDRIRFETDVLFPLAGLDTSEADRYYELLSLKAQLDYADNEAARDYLDGAIDRDAAIEWLIRYTLVSRERAEQRTRFFDTYRSYVINYNLGKDIVRDWVERGEEDAGGHWARFAELLSSPRLPADLR